MKIAIGDFILVKSPCFGYSNSVDLGPFIVQVIDIDGDSFEVRHHIRVDGEFSRASSTGLAHWSEVVAKIHEADVQALFKREIV